MLERRALASGDRTSAVATVRSLFSLPDLVSLLEGNDPEARRAAELLLRAFMPDVQENARFLVDFARRRFGSGANTPSP